MGLYGVEKSVEKAPIKNAPDFSGAPAYKKEVLVPLARSYVYVVILAIAVKPFRFQAVLVGPLLEDPGHIPVRFQLGKIILRNL